MKVQTYTQQGKKGSSVEMSDSVFGLNWNGDLVHHVVTALQANLRKGTAHTKDRSEVRGGGKKPWKQKGTGRARHGSSRSPIWIGGGVTHGPRVEKVYGKKVNVRERAKALSILLSRKLKEGEILFVDAIELKDVKTKEAKGILETLSVVEGFETLLTRKRNNALIVTLEEDADLKRAFSNFSNVEVRPARAISALDVATYKHIVVVRPEDVNNVLETRLNKVPRVRKEVVTA